MEQFKSFNTTTTPAPKKRSGCAKYIFIFLLLAILVGGGWMAWTYYIPFASDGVRSGQLNSVMKKGNIFKTYEGTLIQDGVRGATGGGVQSNTFEFSIEDKAIFDTLKYNSGKRFELQYKEYRGALPWRGNTRYIVDSIISMNDPKTISPF